MRYNHPRRPLRVLYIDHTAKIGGGEIALVNLIRHLDSAFIDPMVLLFADGPLAERLRPHAETHVLALSSTVSAAQKDRLGWKSLLQVKAAWLVLCQIFKVARYARRMQVDLIHTNSLKADIIGGLAARLARIPVIWHVRDRIEADYLPAPVVRLFRALSRRIPDFVIANSAATLATLHLRGRRRGTAIASGIVAESRIGIVHDGCYVDDPQDASPSRDRGPRIGLIGRISPWKGQDVFIKAAALLHTRHPKARFQIIGAALFAEREYETSLRELCHSLRVEHLVEFTGFVEDVSARIAHLDIVVHASTTGEPFGQVIIEGMAEQKPIVATNGGGVPEIVQDGVTGLLVPMGDAVAMADAIDHLLQHPERAAQMGRLGRERVLEKFTIQGTARMVETVYRQVLALAS